MWRSCYSVETHDGQCVVRVHGISVLACEEETAALAAVEGAVELLRLAHAAGGAATRPPAQKDGLADPPPAVTMG
jgi:hypothetical protein